MEFILSPFLNYGFIFISQESSRGGVREERERKEGGRETGYRCKEVWVVVVVPELLAVSKTEGFNGACGDVNLIPTEPELRAM